MAAANGDLPEDRRIILRIGVNLGDIMVESGDRYGDGVNIAARLEGIAEPGGILVSGTIYDHVRNKIDTGFDDLGAQSLKNILEPVRVYRVAGTPRVSVDATKLTSDKPSIAVLPFTNMSGDPEQQYFSDGITADIITELSRFRQLLVIARTIGLRNCGRLHRREACRSRTRHQICGPRWRPEAWKPRSNYCPVDRRHFGQAPLGGTL